MNYSYRELATQDKTLLWHILMIAAHELCIEVVKSNPALVCYVAEWGRAHDMGFVAVETESQAPVGAVWLRLWTGSVKGFGYIDDQTPELAMAVLPEHRNKGIGTQLLAHVLRVADTIYPAVSLNVRADNLALRLYERAGFHKVAGSEIINRTGGVSFNMIKTFER